MAGTGFLMRVAASMGGGYGWRSDGTIGEIREFDLVGERIRGELPPVGSTVTFARTKGEPATACVVNSGVMSDGRVRVRVGGVELRDVADAYALSTNATALAAVAPPTPVPGRPTAADDYADYCGPSVRYTSQPVEDVDVELLIQLGRTPLSEEAASLERAVRAWDEKGVIDGFGTALLWGGAGHLHGLYDDEEFGPRWSGVTLRWLEDFGSADARIAMDDLARRLAGWSAKYGIPIVRLSFGQQGMQ